jgi:hypothetical protein
VKSLLMKQNNQDHRALPRRKKKQFDHQHALACIKHDLAGPEALFVGKDFKMYFRISRSHFQRIMESFGSHGGAFYSSKTDCVGNQTASLEGKLLLPLQTLAFGILPNVEDSCCQVLFHVQQDLPENVS